jgi:hypothetical protein
MTKISKNLLIVCISITILTLSQLSGCVNQNVEDLLDNPLIGCDTLDLKFSTDIQPIFAAACFDCHSQAGATSGVVLEGYNGVKNVVDDGRLVKVINHLPGITPMPFGRPKLPACDIRKIEVWIREGALNN